MNLDSEIEKLRIKGQLSGSSYHYSQSINQQIRASDSSQPKINFNVNDVRRFSNLQSDFATEMHSVNQQEIDGFSQQINNRFHNNIKSFIEMQSSLDMKPSKTFGDHRSSGMSIKHQNSVSSVKESKQSEFKTMRKAGTQEYQS